MWIGCVSISKGTQNLCDIVFISCPYATTNIVGNKFGVVGGVFNACNSGNACSEGVLD